MLYNSAVTLHCTSVSVPENGLDFHLILSSCLLFRSWLPSFFFYPSFLSVSYFSPSTTHPLLLLPTLPPQMHLDNSSPVQWGPSLTRGPLTPVLSGPLPQCGAAAESCTCSGSYTPPCSPPWRASWTRWCGSGRTGMKRWEEQRCWLCVCLTLLLRVCVFNGSDGEKIIQLVVRIFMHLCVCVKASRSAHLVYTCDTPPGQPDDRSLADPVSLVGRHICVVWGVILTCLGIGRHCLN